MNKKSRRRRKKSISIVIGAQTAKYADPRNLGAADSGDIGKAISCITFFYICLSCIFSPSFLLFPSFPLSSFSSPHFSTPRSQVIPISLFRLLPSSSSSSPSFLTFFIPHNYFLPFFNRAPRTLCNISFSLFHSLSQHPTLKLFSSLLSIFPPSFPLSYPLSAPPLSTELLG